MKLHGRSAPWWGTQLSILTLDGRQIRGFSLREKTHVRGANGHVQRSPSHRILNGVSWWASALIAALLVGLGPARVSLAKPANFMVQVRVGNKLLEGRPLSWSKQRVYLLSRDGQLVNFRPKEAHDYRRLSTQFRSYGTGKIRSQLYKEFGRQFDVTGTGHYLVVHPRGQKDLWADRFERLYRSFYHYFQVRGFDLKDPQYPLIAIVFHDRSDYRSYASKDGSPPSPNTLGHYDDWTNRIALFDVTGGKSTRDWSTNAETIIHEATHQTAFNTGVHTRFAGVPRWLCEGLATQFEAPGVWDWHAHRMDRDRVNRRQLEAFRDCLAHRWESGTLANLVASDAKFRSDPAGAYGTSWALSHFLSETRPRRYSKLLAVTAARPPFQPYTADQRSVDFKKIFGDNLKMLEIKFLRYMKTVK